MPELICIASLDILDLDERNIIQSEGWGETQGGGCEYEEKYFFVCYILNKNPTKGEVSALYAYAIHIDKYVRVYNMYYLHSYVSYVKGMCIQMLDDI